MKKELFSKNRWHIIILLLGAVALALHFSFLSFSFIFLGLSLNLYPLFAFIIVGGVPLVAQIFYRLYRREIGSDILAAIAIITAFWQQEYVACALVIMMLAGGQALEAYAVAKASSALEALINRMPKKARRRINGRLEDINIDEIRIGDELIIAPHEASPIDGTVVEGQGHMDESYLSGEPYGVKKAPGAKVLSGALNGENLLVVRADKIAKDSRYAEIIHVMKDAEEKRPKIRRLADQLGAFFAPISLAIAALAWIVSNDAGRFLSVLVVATPCPLLIAIPVAIISTISMAARRGIIIKDPAILERLPTCTTAIFDKTGTLTYGEPEITSILAAPPFSREEVLQKVASLERYSKHPLAKSLLSAAKQSQLALIDAMELSEVAGAGLRGRVDGKEIHITHRKFIEREHPKMSALLPPTTLGLECVVLIDNAYAATIQFRDAPRAMGRTFIKHLFPFHDFNRILLVSGDRSSEVEYLAKEMGIQESFASQSPEQKLALVREETKKAPTLFMGDGINDAPALAAATVGVAFGEKTSVISEAAGAVVLESSLHKVDELLHLSKKMRVIALQSGLGGMALSLIAMGFAFFGLLSPVWGALLQQGIDALAILNALRLAAGKSVKIDLV